MTLTNGRKGFGVFNIIFPQDVCFTHSLLFLVIFCRSFRRSWTSRRKRSRKLGRSRRRARRRRLPPTDRLELPTLLKSSIFLMSSQQYTTRILVLFSSEQGSRASRTCSVARTSTCHNVEHARTDVYVLRHFRTQNSKWRHSKHHMTTTRENINSNTSCWNWKWCSLCVPLSTVHGLF